MKRCPKCKNWKPLDEFSKNRTTKDGFQHWCKECLNACCRKYKQTEKGKQICYKLNKKYRQTIVGHLRQCFINIQRRCNNPRDKDYKYYGKRGIQCRFKSTNQFVDYVMNILRIDPHNLEIDRIDNNGHYESGNIRFVTHQENCNNRRKRKK